MNRVINTQVRNPFPGLRPFRENEEHLFFGRESQVHAMIDKLSATRFLAVVGTSGSGKSSLVNCGLCPALHRGLMAKAGTSWRIAQFRPGGNPLRALARSLSQDGVLFSEFDSNTLVLVDIIEASLRMSKLGLSRIYNDAHLPEKSNLLVVVDQFEELFRYSQVKSSPSTHAQQRSQEAVAFVNLLLDARTHADLPIYVVLTMRSDFLGDCAEFAGLPEGINEGEYLVPRLTRDERKAAITGPIGVGGADITPVLLTRLVNDVGDNPDQLSILQHALNRTWARWENEGQGRGPLDLHHYEAIGGMAHALDQHAEKAYRELPGERHRKICEKIFKAITDKGTDPRGIRRPTKFGVLHRLAEATPDEAAAVLSVFRKPSRSFVMPPLQEELDDDTVIDISHESLMRIWERLIVWTDEEVQSAQLYRRLSETAALQAAGRAGLWSDPDLQSALDWREKEKPTELWAELYSGGFGQAMSFLSASQIQRDQEKREEEERRQRELQQAHELAAERQRRIEEQAHAASRLRRWLVALVVATVCSLFAGGIALLESRRVHQSLADRNRALSIAEQKKKEANEAQIRAEERAQEAVSAEKKAEMADKEMSLEALRVRDTNLQSQSVFVNLADSMLQFTDPQMSAPWRRLKGGALLSLGSFDEAQDSLSKVLERFPDDLDARTERGYILVLRQKPGDALRDFEYIRDNIDRVSPINNLNLTVANAALGNYAAARASLKVALASMHIRDSEGGGEAFIPPDITRATGRATLEARGATFVTAMYYMGANLEAYAGNTDAFQKALARADEQAQSLSPVAKKDAIFVAMTWAWLHLGVRCPDSGARCQDYGGLASQAALWERAEYKDWADCYYEKFQEDNKSWPDRRYVQFADWVEQARKRLGSTSSCQNVKQAEPDVAALEVEAREAAAKTDYTKAKNLISQALAKARAAEKNRLLLERADVLLADGRAEKQRADNEQIIAAAAKWQLELLNNQKKTEEDERQQKLAPKQNWDDIKQQIEAHYEQTLAKPRAEQAEAEKRYRQHTQEYKSAFKELQSDCTEILRTNPMSATAHYYRALAQAWLDLKSKGPILDDLRQSVKLDPANLQALALIDELVPNEGSEQESYLQDNRQFLDRYYKISPYSAATFAHQARLAQIEKRYGDALELISKAIAMNLIDPSLYKLRSEIQLDMGFNDVQVKRNLAEGYRQAGYALRVRENGYSQDAETKEWDTLAELAKQHANDEVQCNAALTTCNITKTVEVNSEWIYGGILTVVHDGDNSKSLEARIDKGREDGIVVGSEGSVWSHYSKGEDGHERLVVKLGTSEVASVEPHSSLVRIQLLQPEGDGLARKQDMVQLKARTPLLPDRSSLWSVAKFNVTFLDLDDQVLFDYDTLYSGETPELDSKLLQRMVQDIRHAGQLYTGPLVPLREGTFAGQSLKQAMENTTTADLQGFLDYQIKYPGDVFGQRIKISTRYAAWLYAGTPSK